MSLGQKSIVFLLMGISLWHFLKQSGLSISHLLLLLMYLYSTVFNIQR